jgi:aspartate/methionine/tyrosine aminotransferase
MFSTRTPSSLAVNRLTEALRARRRTGAAIVDLTLSNPTRAGIAYPAGLLDALADPRALAYDPQPLGMRAAREAVAADYARRGLRADPDRIVLTASTSEAYSVLFKLLADPGDEVLVPRPSYPLFEHLARLDAVRTRPYDLDYHGRWAVDFASLEEAWTPRTRAVLLVSPNNPTGSFLSRGEWTRLSSLAASRGAAVVADEVFADYELEPAPPDGWARVLDTSEGLTISLGGLSKTVGLPQAKLGWAVLAGDRRLVDEATTRLEVINDTYLSASTSVQVAAAPLLERGAAVRAAIQARVAGNYRSLIALGAGAAACDELRSEGGWYAIVRVPTFRHEEELVLELLTEDGVLVHPGYFFEFPKPSFLVVSLLVPEAAFAAGVERLLVRAANPPRPAPAAPAPQ